jgi:23S rRNA (adenine1618-N6)-methyltransferase
MSELQAPEEKNELHPRNLHRKGYDFELLINACPDLAPYVSKNQFGNLSVDFANPDAVKELNKALLQKYYGVKHWDIPTQYLCPPIPGRADYIHHMADLLASCNETKIPKGKKIQVLDVGVGANCIYPLLGHALYGWKFIGSDYDPTSIRNAQAIAKANKPFDKNIECRLQSTQNHAFQGIINPSDRFDLTVCNPPFHSSQLEAMEGTLKKLKNLGLNNSSKAVLNFGGQSNELWCRGGEAQFIKNMIEQSVEFAQQCFWFTTLVSKSENLAGIYKSLELVKAAEVKTIPMAQGQKTSRVVAWTFLKPEQQKIWAEERWA